MIVSQTVIVKSSVIDLHIYIIYSAHCTDSDLQLLVYKVNKIGDNTHPCGAPVHELTVSERTHFKLEKILTTLVQEAVNPCYDIVINIHTNQSF